MGQRLSIPQIALSAYNMLIGGGLFIKTGTNQAAGTSVLVGGTVTVANTRITATSLVLCTINGVGVLVNAAAVYEDFATRVAGTSFTIKSLNVLATDTVAWLIVEPA